MRGKAARAKHPSFRWHRGTNPFVFDADVTKDATSTEGGKDGSAASGGREWHPEAASDGPAGDAGPEAAADLGASADAGD